jgi:7-keto-8-aminopelargonate synthetase-like enzyme
VTADPRQTARDLLARAASPAQSVSPTRGRGSSRPRPATSFNDHADVVRVREMYGGLEQMFEAAPVLNPLFQPHVGTNGITIGRDGRELINFGSFSYLGLVDDPRVQSAAKAAIDDYGTSVSASRIVSGEIPLYGELEGRLAECYDVDDAVVTVSGYSTNASVIGYLLGPNDIAVCDALVHSSIISGARWSGCKRVIFQHNDPESLDALLRMSRNSFARAMVIIEGHYSMDGDVAALPELIAVARRHDCSVMIDEAHSFGVLGARGMGVRDLFSLPGAAVDIWMGTLSKSLASCGGFVAGNSDLIRALRYSAPGVSLYATGAAPSTVGAALEALRILQSDPARVRRLQDNGRALHASARAHGFDTGFSEGTPIVPVILGDTTKAVMSSLWMAQEGFNVPAIGAPSVREGQERLRFCASSGHTAEQIDLAMSTLRKVVDGL